MKLAVILATYNRCDLLPRCIEAFLAARVPEGVTANLLVVDNNSTDGTRAVVARYADAFSERVEYLFEPQAGKCHALNTGIEASSGDVIGFIDDDETIAPNWVEVVAREMVRPELDFVGGPYVPNWLAPRPSWYSESFRGAIGDCDNLRERARYGTDKAPLLVLGGNAVVRRYVFARVGQYSSRYPYAEDLDMYRRIMDAGFVGDYVPDLVIHHNVPVYRLTKRYFRHWAYTAARNDGKMERDGRRMHREPRICGIPRWMMQRAAEGLLLRLWRAGRPGDAAAFAGELEAISLAGYLRGRYIPIPERIQDRSGGAVHG